MSRHNVTYKPGGAIAKPLDLTLKMQRVTPETECQACSVNAVAEWFIEDGFDPKQLADYNLSIPVGHWDSADRTQYYTAGEFDLIFDSFIYHARVSGETCGLDITWAVTWQWSGGSPLDTVPPYVFHAGNHAVVKNCDMGMYVPGASGDTLLLTMTPSVAGVALNTLTLLFAEAIP